MIQPNHNRSPRYFTRWPLLDILLGLFFGLVGSYVIIVVVGAVGVCLQPSYKYLIRLDIILAIAAICSAVACYYTGRWWRILGSAAVIGAVVALSLYFYVGHLDFHAVDYIQQFGSDNLIVPKTLPL